MKYIYRGSYHFSSSGQYNHLTVLTNDKQTMVKNKQNKVCWQPWPKAICPLMRWLDVWRRICSSKLLLSLQVSFILDGVCSRRNYGPLLETWNSVALFVLVFVFKHIMCNFLFPSSSCFSCLRLLRCWLLASLLTPWHPWAYHI